MHTRARALSLAILLSAGLAAGLGGCVPVVMSGITAGAVASTEERGLGGAVNDAQIQAEINHLWLQSNIELLEDLDITVDQGRVLLTGKSKNAEQRLEAVRLAWQATGVREVINEIEITDKSSIKDDARDTWISTQLRSRMLFDKNIASRNYTIDTVNGVVYLMGTARDQAELDRALGHAKAIAYVQRVVSYVKVP